MFNWIYRKWYNIDRRKLKGKFKLKTEGGTYLCKNVEIIDLKFGRLGVSIRGDIIETDNELFKKEGLDHVHFGIDNLISLDKVPEPSEAKP